MGGKKNPKGRIFCYPLLRACAGLVQAEQAGEDFVFSEGSGAPIIAPAIGFGHRFIERLVGVVEPSGAGVVEVCQRALFQGGGGGFVFGQDAIRVACHHFGNAGDQIGRVQPVFAQFIQARGGGGNFLRARIGGIIGGGNVGGEALREGEGFETK